MKYVTYAIFIIFILVLVVFLKNALESAPEPVRITGSNKCGECHQLKMEGDQQTVWLNSKHANAYKSLFTQAAIDFTRSNNLTEPPQNETCLRCHTTAGFLGKVEKELSYYTAEGVGCESCHGAGSGYSPAEIMKDEALFIRHGGVKGDAETCLKCHSLHANPEHKLRDDLCPFQDEDFVYTTAFEKIKHPVNKDNFK